MQACCITRPGIDHLVFDFETVPDPALHQPSPAEAANPRLMAPLPVQRLVCIGTLRLGADYAPKELATLGDPDDERGMVGSFIDVVERDQPRLVSFAGRSFDIPVLLLRAMRHDLAVPWYFDGERYRRRYAEGEAHVDLAEALGRVRHLSLKAAVRLAGLPGKLDVDGSDVARLYEQGERETIDHYCLMDVVQTAFLLLRVRRVQGRLSAESHRRATRRLYEGLRDDPRLAALWAATDLALLLGPNP